jgi:hypothetical protein
VRSVVTPAAITVVTLKNSILVVSAVREAVVIVHILEERRMYSKTLMILKKV